MKVLFLTPAENELAEAMRYYNEQSEGLGYEFAAEVQRTVERIVRYPDAWTPLSHRTRRCRLRRFPFGLVYQVRDESILVVAVMHLRQKPVSWSSRTQDDH